VHREREIEEGVAELAGVDEFLGYLRRRLTDVP